MRDDHRFASLPGHVWQQMNAEDGIELDEMLWPDAPVFGVDTDPALWPEDLEGDIYARAGQAAGEDEERWRLLVQHPEALAKLGDLMGRD